MSNCIVSSKVAKASSCYCYGWICWAELQAGIPVQNCCAELVGRIGGQNWWAELKGGICGQNCWAELLGRTVMWNYWAELQVRIAGQNCWAELLSRISGQNCWAELLGRIAGQNCWAELLGRRMGWNSRAEFDMKIRCFLQNYQSSSKFVKKFYNIRPVWQSGKAYQAQTLYLIGSNLRFEEKKSFSKICPFRDDSLLYCMSMVSSRFKPTVVPGYTN